MSVFSADMLPLIDAYQRETAELLDEYNRCLMEISREKRVTPEEINGVFRVVHTIKGSSAMIGMNALSSFAHRMEDLLLLFRDDAKRADGNEERLIDIMYAFGDYVAGETTAMADEGFAPAPCDELKSRVNDELNYFAALESARNSPLSDSAPVPPPAKEAPPPRPAANSVSWRVLFKDDCAMENVRAFLLIKQLRPLCSSLSSMPGDLEKKNAAELIRSEGLILTVTAHDIQKVSEFLKSSAYIKEIRDIDERDFADGKDPGAQRNRPSDKGPKFGMVAWDSILKLQNLTGELITSYTLIKTALENTPVYRELEDDLIQNRRLLGDLESLVTSASMTPVSGIASQYYRLVRDISVKEGKRVEFHLSGEDLELDRNLLDAMANPLIHLIRNAVDHGIEAPDIRAERGKPEAGEIRLDIAISGGNVRFTVSDDGNGIDPAEILKKAKEKNMLSRPESAYTASEILKFIFAPGFSTTITPNQYSGRGVGMDVVRNTADSLHGVVRIDSVPGRGSSISVEVPVSVSSSECLMFSAGSHVCLIPMRCVDSVIAYRDAVKDIRAIDGRMWFERDEVLPVIDLLSLFSQAEVSDKRLLVIRGMERSAALLTGPVLGETTAVEKPLPAILRRKYSRRFGISGCSVIGAGKLGLVLSAELLLKEPYEKGEAPA